MSDTGKILDESEQLIRSLIISGSLSDDQIATAKSVEAGFVLLRNLLESGKKEDALVEAENLISVWETELADKRVSDQWSETSREESTKLLRNFDALPGKIRSASNKVAASYSTPADPEKMMADFYALELLYYHTSKNMKNVDGKWVQHFFPEMFSRNIEDAFKTCVVSLKKRFEEDLPLIIAAELRHIFDALKYEDYEGEDEDDEASLPPDEIKGVMPVEWLPTFRMYDSSYNSTYKLKDQNLLNKCNYPDYAHSYTALVRATGGNVTKMIAFARTCFDELPWKAGYGGKAWVSICDAFTNLHKASEINEIAIQIDHIIDIQHNTGTLFNKLSTYNKNGYQWVGEFLDFKKEAELSHLATYCSPQVRGWVAYVTDTKLDFEEYSETLVEALKKHLAGSKPLGGEFTEINESLTPRGLFLTYKKGSVELELKAFFLKLGTNQVRLKYSLQPFTVSGSLDKDVKAFDEAVEELLKIYLQDAEEDSDDYERLMKHGA